MCGTHGSHRSEWRWCPRRCSVARSDPASPASESGSSRVSPAAPSLGSRRRWTRSPAGTWTKPPALLPTLGGGRRAETPWTPRCSGEHRPPSRWSRLRGEERSRCRGEDGGMEGAGRGRSHLRTGVLQCNPSLLLPFPLSFPGPLLHKHFLFARSLSLSHLPAHQPLSVSLKFYHSLSSALILW